MTDSKLRGRAVSQPPREKQIAAAVVALIKKLPDGHARKVHGEAFGTAGEPDVDAVVDGRAVKLEVKRPGGTKPTPLQARALDRWQDAGALCGVVRSVDDARALLGAYGLAGETVDLDEQERALREVEWRARNADPLV